MTNTSFAESDSGWQKKWQIRLLVLGICLLAGGLYYHFFVNTAYVELELEVDRKTEFKIYWATSTHHYSEIFVATVNAVPEKKNYSVWLTNLRNVTQLRIDTHSYEGEARLGKLSILQEGIEPIQLDSPDDFKDLTVYGQVKESWADETGLHIVSSGSDPNFEFIPQVKTTQLLSPWLLGRLITVILLAFIIIYCAGRWVQHLRVVPLLLFGVWALVIVMAGISQYNVHPDEYVHMAATKYYEDHWLPPVLEDPEIRDTYSVYGISRLNNGEIYYLFAGKFYKFLKSFRVPEDFALRAFNLLLFGLVFLYTARNRYARMVAIPFLLSPQIWYVFSYCASDAFALYISFVAACQIIDSESMFNKYLKGEGKTPAVVALVCMGVLLGVLILLKKNYYPFIGLLFIFLVIKLFWSEEFYWERRSAILRLTAICVIGLSVAGLRAAADYQVNGPDREKKIQTIREELADPLYKPSTPLAEKHMFLMRKARGATLKQIIVVDRWFEHTFRSAFGVFGYFTISAPNKYYSLVRWAGAGLLVFFLFSIYLRGGWSGAVTATSTLGLAAALIAMSLYMSWTNDFQTQGRYLFPIAPMLGLLYAWNYRIVNEKILILGVLPMYFLAAYAFVFEGILRIPKL